MKHRTYFRQNFNVELIQCILLLGVLEEKIKRILRNQVARFVLSPNCLSMKITMAHEDNQAWQNTLTIWFQPFDDSRSTKQVTSTDLYFEVSLLKSDPC